MMTLVADGSGPPLPSLSRQLSPGDVNMDLTMCGLFVERAEETRSTLCRTRELERCQERWFDERLSNRSTRGSSQKIYRVLTSRFKNAPTDLPNPSVLPTIFDECQTTRDKAQILYLYLVADDSLVRYVVHEYMARLTDGNTDSLDFERDACRYPHSPRVLLTAAPSTMRIRRLSGGGARAFDQ